MEFKQGVFLALIGGAFSIFCVALGWFLNERISKVEMAEVCREEIQFLEQQESVDLITPEMFNCPSMKWELLSRSIAENDPKVEEKIEIARRHILASRDTVLSKLGNCTDARCQDHLKSINALLAERDQILLGIDETALKLKSVFDERKNAVISLNEDESICGFSCSGLSEQISLLRTQVSQSQSRIDGLQKELIGLLIEASDLLEKDQ